MSQPLLKRLIERRVPQYLALYVGAGWGVLEFMVFLQDTFMLSPEWAKLALLALALLIPSVILFSWFHGRPGRDRWMRLELVGIPLNVVVALLVLLVEFGGKDLGAQVKTVTVTDESGQEIERVVPKSEYRKRVAVFYFDGMDGDTTQWLQYGVPSALLTDLAQDMFVDLRFGPFFRERLRQAGYASELRVPMALKREIARDNHMGYIVSGEVKPADGGFTARVALHDALSSREVGEWTFTEATPQALTDRISLEIRKGLGIPGKHIEQSADLPVSDIMTPSVPAFRDFAEALRLMEVDDDYGGAAAALERAIAHDPTFTNAHYTLYAVAVLGNRAERAMPALQAAMDHLYRMPERVQNVVKLEHYLMTRQQEKAFAVAQLTTELYPDDIRSLQLLTQLQIMRDEKDDAIRSLRRMLELDPQQAEMLQHIGDLYVAKGSLDSALTYFSQYAERFPDRRESFVRLGDVQVRAGRLDEARRDYEKALLIEPSSVPVMLKLAALDRDLGRLAEAERGLEEALERARTAETRTQALQALEAYHTWRGRARAAADYNERVLAEAAKFQAPFMVAIEELTSLGVYVRAGRTEAAEQRLARLKQELVAPMDMYLPMGEVEVAVERGQRERALAAIAATEDLRRTIGLEVVAPHAAQARGELHRRDGNWKAAVTEFERVLELDPSRVETYADVAESYRNLGQPDRALAAARELLRIQPANPRANLEAGLVELGRGRHGEARQHLELAARMWADADPGHAGAERTRAALRQLAGTSHT